MSSGILVAILSLAAMAGAKATAPAGTNGSPFHLSGYIQGRFTNARDTPDRFEVRRARLLLNGDLNSRISYLVQGDVWKLPGLLDADERSLDRVSVFVVDRNTKICFVSVLLVEVADFHGVLRKRSASRRLCSHLKHDFAWSVACGAVLKRFACASQWKHLG